MEEQRHLLKQCSTSIGPSEDEWSDEASTSSHSYTSGSDDSSIPEWSTAIDEETGELLYIDCHPFVTQNAPTDQNAGTQKASSFGRNMGPRRSTRGKFLRLIRRRDSKRHSRRVRGQENSENAGAKVKFQDSQEGEEKEVILKVSSDVKRGGNSLAEIFLGLSVGALSDGQRVMVSGVLPDSPAKYEKTIKIGDWLKSVNNVSVTVSNLNDVIKQQVMKRNQVLLTLQRVAGVEVTKNPPINELNYQSQFVREFISPNSQKHVELCEILSEKPLGLMYLNTLNQCSDGEDGGGLDFDNILYHYPCNKTALICTWRPIFVTLYDLVNDITKVAPQISTFVYRNVNREQFMHVSYAKFGDNLLLIMLPQNICSHHDIGLILTQLIRMFQFMYRTIDACFSVNNVSVLDAFFDRMFVRLLNRSAWQTIDDFVNKQWHNNDTVKRSNFISFESMLPYAPALNLPNEALSQIDDALTELEASDYRDWNEEPLDCQRLFTILGSALFHAGYLLLSHLNYEDLTDVYTFCEQQGFFHLCRTEPLKCVLSWRECHPSTCRFGVNMVPAGRRYLLVVGVAKDLLAVIMEAGGCTEPSTFNTAPDAFYVEEVQATLAHIQELGISELAARWMSMNPGPQVTVPGSSKRKSQDFFTLTRQATLKGVEVTSILKRRNSDHQIRNTQAPSSSATLPTDSHRTFGSCNLDQYDSILECYDSNSSNVDDDDDDDEDDDSENGIGSQSEDSGTDTSVSRDLSIGISELRQSLLNDMEPIKPQQLTAGEENILFHYVELNQGDGILVCPPPCRIQSQTLDIIMCTFRKCCHQIRQIFQNTLRFKNMQVQDMAKCVMNKSLIAIKEYGVLFDGPILSSDNDKKTTSNSGTVKYWVVGKLFHMPHPREIYVCYQDSIPQNMVELAFKLELGNMV